MRNIELDTKGIELAFGHEEAESIYCLDLHEMAPKLFIQVVINKMFSTNPLS